MQEIMPEEISDEQQYKEGLAQMTDKQLWEFAIKETKKEIGALQKQINIRRRVISRLKENMKKYKRFPREQIG